MFNKPKIQIGLIIALLISVLLYFLGKQIPEEAVKSFILGTGPWAGVIYILSHQLSYILAPISGLPFLIIGFYLFGKNVVIYTYFVVLIGASINFWISRKWGRSVVSKFAGEDSLKKIDKISKEYGIVTLIALRILQGGIGDFVSYAYGLTPIKFSTYIIITAIAIIPGNIVWYFVVSKTNSLEGSLAFTILLAFCSIIIFLGGNYLIRKYKNFRKMTRL